MWKRTEQDLILEWKSWMANDIFLVESAMQLLSRGSSLSQTGLLSLAEVALNCSGTFQVLRNLCPLLGVKALGHLYVGWCMCTVHLPFLPTLTSIAYVTKWSTILLCVTLLCRWFPWLISPCGSKISLRKPTSIVTVTLMKRKSSVSVESWTSVFQKQQYDRSFWWAPLHHRFVLD